MAEEVEAMTKWITRHDGRSAHSLEASAFVNFSQNASTTLAKRLFALSPIIQSYSPHNSHL
jgi:hypothetical protein